MSYPAIKQQKDTQVKACDALLRWRNGQHVSIVASPMQELVGVGLAAWGGDAGVPPGDGDVFCGGMS